eukprot:TRINITY_DN978_c1_g1_i12.p1 TRINITY_DN978_c1_g1~~TRINITY_DN978_c1_g1_i12.p1  ORF type:complete len:479 (-),score=30.26 TRINITY_DN978_c1_g1_i12:442-1821(-)
MSSTQASKRPFSKNNIFDNHPLYITGQFQHNNFPNVTKIQKTNLKDKKVSFTKRKQIVNQQKSFYNAVQYQSKINREYNGCQILQSQHRKQALNELQFNFSQRKTIYNEQFLDRSLPLEDGTSLMCKIKERQKSTIQKQRGYLSKQFCDLLQIQNDKTNDTKIVVDDYYKSSNFFSRFSRDTMQLEGPSQNFNFNILDNAQNTHIFKHPLLKRSTYSSDKLAFNSKIVFDKDNLQLSNFEMDEVENFIKSNENLQCSNNRQDRNSQTSSSSDITQLGQSRRRDHIGYIQVNWDDIEVQAEFQGGWGRYPLWRRITYHSLRFMRRCIRKLSRPFSGKRRYGGGGGDRGNGGGGNGGSDGYGSDGESVPPFLVLLGVICFTILCWMVYNKLYKRYSKSKVDRPVKAINVYKQTEFGDEDDFLQHLGLEWVEGIDTGAFSQSLQSVQNRQISKSKITNYRSS